jgi:hypothetical protein
MDKSKTVVYPSILESINAAVEAHSAVHDAVKTHAQAHHAALVAKREQLHVAQVAKKLIEEDGKK